LLDPEVVNSLGYLEIISTQIVEGLLSGKHRSPFLGSSVEFAQHRPYNVGDEIRKIYWRAYGKSDRYYVKEFEEETNLQVMVVVDASGSMAYGMGTLTKWRYAQMTAACLARLMLRQRDTVGLTVLDTGMREYIPPRSRPSHLHVILDTLTRTQPGGETSLGNLLKDLAVRVRRRGMIIICSDCFDDVDSILTALRHLRLRGHEVLLFHIMAPEELSFSFQNWSRFESLEIAGERIDLDPALIRKHYLSELETFLNRLRQGCGEAECEYLPLVTNRPLGESLAYYIARRAARMK
jgi:uncharacterized protein (DUF58 family)